MPAPVQVRAERAGDEAGIRAVHHAAFGQAAEGEIVDAIRAAGAVTLSLVAASDGPVLGHVLFSPAWIGRRRAAVALGPLAVHPDHQGRGIGTALVREGLLRLRGLGIRGVVVLGDPRYYSRFGFRRASGMGLSPLQPWPDEAFQALELAPRAFTRGGRVRYHRAFG